MYLLFFILNLFDNLLFNNFQIIPQTIEVALIFLSNLMLTPISYRHLNLQLFNSFFSLSQLVLTCQNLRIKILLFNVQGFYFFQKFGFFSGKFLNALFVVIFNVVKFTGRFTVRWLDWFEWFYWFAWTNATLALDWIMDMVGATGSLLLLAVVMWELLPEPEIILFHLFLNIG